MAKGIDKRKARLIAAAYAKVTTLDESDDEEPIPDTAVRLTVEGYLQQTSVAQQNM